jgi:hypothetical protein
MESAGIMITTTTNDDVTSPLYTASVATCITTRSRSKQSTSLASSTIPPMDFARLKLLQSLFPTTDNDDPDYKM